MMHICLTSSRQVANCLIEKVCKVISDERAAARNMLRSDSVTESDTAYRIADCTTSTAGQLKAQVVII